MLLPPHVHQQHRNIRRAHPTDPAGLTDGARLELRKLGAGFLAERRKRMVVDVFVQTHRFEAVHLVDHLFDVMPVSQVFLCKDSEHIIVSK